MTPKATAKRKPKSDLDKVRASWAKDEAKDNTSPEGSYHPFYVTPAQEPALKSLRLQILNVANLLEVGGVDNDLHKLANPPRETALAMWNELQPRRHAISGEWISFPDADNPKVVTRRKIMRGIIGAVSPLCSGVANFDATKTPRVVWSLRKIAALLNDEIHPNNREPGEPAGNARPVATGLADDAKRADDRHGGKPTVDESLIRMPLGEKAAKLYEMLILLPEHRGMTAPAILNWFSDEHRENVSQGTLTKEIIPALKPYGLRNAPRIGYFIPLAERPQKISS